jgi:mannan endo-1,4-beta-mannosidase
MKHRRLRWAGLLFLPLALIVACSISSSTAEVKTSPSLPLALRPQSYSSSQVACLDRTVRTANPSAMPEAKQILAYLRDLPNRRDERIISAQAIGGGDKSGFKDVNDIQKKTGRWVGMIGNDYALMHETNIKGNVHLIDYWNKGGLVTISFHALNPENPGFFSVTKKKITFGDLFRPETKTYQNWRKDLDKVATGLAELRDRGIVVLWRPFHEMNKDFFWWGKRDVGEFVRLWRDTFDYLTKEKKLNNLLWVYSPYQAPDTDKYYPGDAYVDIVAMDAYETNPEKIQGYEALAKIDKPFGFSEYGPSGKMIIVIPVVDKNVDYNAIFQGIKKRFPKTTFIQAWHDAWAFNKHRNIDIMMNDPWMITREDLAWKQICAGRAGR